MTARFANALLRMPCACDRRRAEAEQAGLVDPQANPATVARASMSRNVREVRTSCRCDDTGGPAGRARNLAQVRGSDTKFQLAMFDLPGVVEFVTHQAAALETVAILTSFRRFGTAGVAPLEWSLLR